MIDHPGTTFIFFLSYISPSNIVLNGKYDLSKALYAIIQIVKSEKMESKGINIVSKEVLWTQNFLGKKQEHKYKYFFLEFLCDNNTYQMLFILLSRGRNPIQN